MGISVSAEGSFLRGWDIKRVQRSSDIKKQTRNFPHSKTYRAKDWIWWLGKSKGEKTFLRGGKN